MRLVLAFSLAVVTGCASTSPEPAFRGVAELVEQRSGHKLHWDRGTVEDAEVARSVRRALSRELTVEGAVQIALVNNQALLATYEDLGIAQADLVQAGLLKNPVFSASVTTAERENLDPNLVVGVVQDFLDLLVLPARKKVAASTLEQVKFRVADAALQLAADVRSAFFALQGAQQIVAMRRVIAETAEASLDLATRQQQAGNLSDLALATERGQYEQLKLDLARSEGDVLGARERVTRLMGVWGPDLAYTVASKLPDIPNEEPVLDRLESSAVAQRLDLAALRQETTTLGYALSLSTSSRWTGAINVGADVARLKSGEIVVGPTISLEIPLFDQRTAAIARLEAMLRQAERRLAARAVEVRSEVRSARDRLVQARRLAEHYRGVVVPLREKIVALSQQEYDAMLLGVYQLILAKQNEVNTYREYIEAVRDYWVVRSDLERAVGGRLPVKPMPVSPARAPSAPQPASPAPAPHHHTP